MSKVHTFLLLLLLSVSGVGQTAPQRIISLAPSLTKSLYYLGADDLIVGHTSYCHIAKDDNKEIVASAVTVNIEKVVILRPDLVITTAMTNPETIEIIQRAGIKTKVFQTPRSFDEICSQFEILGNLTGTSETASIIIKDVTKKVYEIKESHNYNTSPDFFFQIGSKPLFTVLENTFMDDYITFSGGKNIAAGFTRGTINREFVLMQNPDVIIIVNMGISGEEEKKIWESYPFLNAVKNKKVFFVESDMASTPNPPDFLSTLESIRKQLEPGWWKD
jgi:ABC-type Fe3+-hydroxamate transport system substrate-binding protein